MSEKQISVVICDDHTLFRAGVRQLLESAQGFRVAGEAADAERAIAAVASARPDVLLLDIVMPGRTGIEAIPDLLAASPGTAILVLSMQNEPNCVRQALAAGARGYLTKEAAFADLAQAVEDVAAGRRYLHPIIVTAAAKEVVHAGESPLSRREREVLRRLALGYTNKEIAKQLFISVRTAEAHRAWIMRKLGLASRADLVQYAFESGILEPARKLTA